MKRSTPLPFSLATYNILAQAYITPGWYPRLHGLSEGQHYHNSHATRHQLTMACVKDTPFEIHPPPAPLQTIKRPSRLLSKNASQSLRDAKGMYGPALHRLPVDLCASVGAMLPWRVSTAV